MNYLYRAARAIRSAPSQGAGTYLPPVFVFTCWDRVTKEEDKRDLKRTLERMWVELQKRDWENSGGAASSLQDHSDGVNVFYLYEMMFHLSVQNTHSNSRIAQRHRTLVNTM